MTAEEALVFLPHDRKFDVGQVPLGQEVHLIENSWWVAHPEHGLAFARAAGGRSTRYCSPQCNVNQAVARKLQQRLYPSIGIVFEPIVYVRRAISGAYLIPAGVLA